MKTQAEEPCWTAAELAAALERCKSVLHEQGTTDKAIATYLRRDSRLTFTLAPDGLSRPRTSGPRATMRP
jgi:hypothetical protein